MSDEIQAKYSTTNKKIRIIIASEYFPSSEKAETTGGVENRYFNLVKFLSETEKYEIIVLATKQPGQQKVSTVFSAKVIRCGFEIPYSNSGNVFSRIFATFAMFWQGSKFGKADIVEAGSFMTYFSIYLLGKYLNAKKIVCWHETWVGDWIKNKGFITGLFGEVWERLSQKLCWDKIISISHWTSAKLVKNGVSCKNISVIPNGIDFSWNKLVDKTKNKKPTLVFLGRLTPQKHLDTLLYALPIIIKKIPDIQLYVVGGGPCLEQWKSLAKHLELTKRVTFFGRMPTYLEFVAPAGKTHVFVSPSVLEGFGIALLDAMSLGLPVVVSDIPPFIEVTEQGKGGLIFKQKNHKDLAEKIILLLTNKKLYAQKAKEAITLAKKYDWKNVVKQYQKVYESLIIK